MKPWTQLAQVQSPDGVLSLMKRGKKDYIIKIDNQVLMNSHLSISEKELAKSAIGAMPFAKQPRVLVSGLGMGITLNSALSLLPKNASVLVAELNQIIVDWCKGPMADLSDNSLDDKRVKLMLRDVSGVIMEASSPGAKKFDAIILDLYEGTGAANSNNQDLFYGFDALMITKDALIKGGIFAVWTEGTDLTFERRAIRAGYKIEQCELRKGGPRHAVYILTKKK